MFSLICVWINGWVNNLEAGDLRRYRAHYDVTVMLSRNIKVECTLVCCYYVLPLLSLISRFTSILGELRHGGLKCHHTVQYVHVNGPWLFIYPLQWRHNGHDGISNHQLHDCLLNRLFRRRSKKTSKLRVTSLCAENSPVTGEFPTQKASYTENVSIWWRHHTDICCVGDLFETTASRFAIDIDTLYRLTLIIPRIIIVTCPVMCGTKLLIHFQVPTTQPLKLENGSIISLHTLKWCNYSSILRLNLINVSKTMFQILIGNTSCRIILSLSKYQL